MSRAKEIGGGVLAILLALAAVAAVQSVLRTGSSEQRRRNDSAASGTLGNAGRGRLEILASGCGACHVIPGIPAARGRVGPSLEGFSERAYIAGIAPNNAANLVRWIEDPRRMSRRTAMPALGLSEEQARDVAAFLYAR